MPFLNNKKAILLWEREDSHMQFKFLSATLFVNDIKTSRQFYEEVLGQKVDMDFGLSLSYVGGFALWQREHAMQVIFDKKTPGVTPGGQPELELGFETDDLDAAIRRLDAAGVKYEHPLVEQPWGQRVVRFYDPDQHLIELGEPMTVVVSRLLSQGQSIQQVAEQTAMPLELVQQIAAQA
jgi:catechol 2,3-dioxygenase-like lactoylglutathione lyase family enzyme